MPKLRQSKEQQLNTQLLAAVNRGLTILGKRCTGRVLGSILHCCKTTACKKLDDPGTLTLRECRVLASSLSFTDEEILGMLR